MSLKNTEQLVLLALVSLGENAYGVTIRGAIEERSGRDVPIATVYAVLDRLESRGLAESWLSDPLPERGGRARKHYRLSRRGADALLTAREVMNRMWEGVDVLGAVSR